MDFNQVSPQNSGNSSMDPSKLMILIGSVVAIIGCFLPFASVSMFGVSASVSYMEGDGVIVLVLSIVAIALAFFKTKLAFIASGLGLIVTLYDSFKIVTEMSFDVLGLGAYIIIIASIVAIVGSVKSK